MPVIRFDVNELERLLRKDVPRDELARTIPLLGADPEDTSGDTWAIEFYPDRPDLFTVEGIARALRAWYGVEPGLARYETRASGHALAVDPSTENVRAFIAAGFVRGVEITQARLDALIDLQEDLHWGLGARRRRVAIGIHDAAAIAAPFTYTTWGLDERTFVPLYETREMTPREILTKHEKGTQYAHILEGHERVPIILDANGGVVSMPPIINAARTAVTTSTRDVFLDVTGTDAWAVERTLNILATALVEAGGTLETVRVERGPDVRVTPELAAESRELSVAETNAVLGSEFTAQEVAEKLARMGYGAKAKGKASVSVEVPPYRADILHDWDLIEDVAIGHGLANFTHLPTRAPTVGTELPENKLASRARASLVGLGFLETMSLTLSNPRDQFERMQRPSVASVDVKNPVTEDVTMLRVSVLPALLGILKKNAHRDLPQRLFEVGLVARREGEADHYERRVAGVIIQGRSNFSEVKGIVLALARDLGWEGATAVQKADDPAFIPGRCAALGERGVFGEVHPAVLEAFGLSHPVMAFELHLGRGPGRAVRGPMDQDA